MKKLRALLIVLAAVCVCFSGTAETATALPASESPAPETQAPVTPDMGAVERSLRKQPVEMPLGDEYLKQEWGVTTFRGNAFRQNAACGTVGSGTDRMEVLWDFRSELKDTDADQQFSWPGQPVILKWSIQVRDKTRFREGFEPHSGMKEVIIAQDNGTIRFLDLESGEMTRDPLETGYTLRSTIAAHTSGIPYLCIGQTDGSGRIGLRQFNMYDLSEIPLIDGMDENVRGIACGNGAFVSAALIDRISDTVITAGSNGFLYKILLRIKFDYKDGTLEIDPVVSAAKRKNTGLSPDDPRTGYAAPVSALSCYIYCADLAGMLRCVESREMKSVWEKDLNDAVVSSIALDQQTGRIALYAANTLTNREQGSASVFCCNALDGGEYWQRSFDVKKDSDLPFASGGFVASPVVGRHELDDLIYYTITGLTRSGRKELGLAGMERSALIAMDKRTGATAWVYGMDGYCCSSPVAVYDEEGQGRIIQCASDGHITLLDGRQGNVISTIRVDGAIDASPAVYRDIMVIASTGTDYAHVYGICLYPEAEGSRWVQQDEPATGIPEELNTIAPTAEPTEQKVYETFIPFRTPGPADNEAGTGQNQASSFHAD